MNRKWFFISSLCLIFALLFYWKNNLGAKRHIQAQNEKKITIFLAGDSTVSNYPSSKFPKAGWGQKLAEFFDDRIVVKNKAVRGRSTKSFIEEGLLDEIIKEMNKGDYLFIQFGHNDQKKYDPYRYTEPSTTYKSNLKKFIDGSRKKGGIPILITPVETRHFTEEGILLDSHGKYPEAMKEVGIDSQVPVIDLTTKSKELFQQLGAEKTKELFLFLNPGEYPYYPNGIKDNVHFQGKGATEIAKLVVEGIVELKLPLYKHIKKLKEVHE